MNIYAIKEESQALEEIGLCLETSERYPCPHPASNWNWPWSDCPSWPTLTSCSSGARC
jgi:hypothetical protein